ncbi:hypothetical protein PZN54_11130 [Staphylococcus capitis]|uniref:hypothetical protein n=1 Tax=Staphylococcus capitis TaxID=29388 RepID=UPI0024809B0C|nr:hypothetical protein [Staphylococcus capitis]MDH9600733.1 hypothetical protein [Staphylococcus capitis]MDH9624353.1 hypothetical protein [Staphylococcus capitis]
MILTNEANFELQELRELTTNNSGQAIDFNFRGHHYTFVSEDDHIILRIDGDNIGYLWFESYDEVRFEYWDTDKNVWVEWLDELDAYIYKYEV